MEENRQIVNLIPESDPILQLLTDGPQTSTDLAEQLSISRQAVHVRLVNLEKESLVESSGKGRATRWFLRRQVDTTFAWTIDSEAQEDLMWADIKRSPFLDGASEASRKAIVFAVTEMLNNAIDHSSGSVVVANLWRSENKLVIEIADDGIGAFQNVMDFFGLESERDAIAHLSKGKQTTAEHAHSGQGIFFTSKIVERFEIASHESVWLVDNVREDQTIISRQYVKGTSVKMTFDLTSTRNPGSVFSDFTDPETLHFNKTVLHVVLANHGEEFVSRSEAKRLAFQLEMFGEVILDFKGVKAVGQGFVDELLRVWPANNPGTRLIPVNMNDDVSFMVNRGLSSS